MFQRLQQQRFIYSPHAARSSVTKRVAAPAFSFNLSAVNPVNKVVRVRTRMTGPGQPHASDLHRAPPTHCSPSLYLPVWGEGEEPTARTSRSRQSQFELDSRLPAGLQPHPHRLLLTNSAPKTTYHCWDYWTHTHTHTQHVDGLQCSGKYWHIVAKKAFCASSFVMNLEMWIHINVAWL